MTSLVNTETGEIVEQGPLNDIERQRLEREESAIEAGAARIGRALAVIRDQRLYRETHATFEDYCHERWGIGRSYANKQIAAAKVTEALGTTGTHLPERAARELAPLLDDPDLLADVWQAALEKSAGKPTAAIIREVRESLVAPEPESVRPEIRQPSPRRAPLPDAYFRSIYDLQRRAESLVRLTQDDRFASNRRAVTGRHGSDALRVLLNVSSAVAQLDAATLAENEEARQWWLTSLNEISEVLSDFGNTLKES